MGVACFYDHADLFGNVFNSSRTMFALINGDSILLVFQELQMNADTGYVVSWQLHFAFIAPVAIVQTPTTKEDKTLVLRRQSFQKTN